LGFERDLCGFVGPQGLCVGDYGYPVIGRAQGIFTRIDRLPIGANYNTFGDDPQRHCLLSSTKFQDETLNDKLAAAQQSR
jgi:hypothetical protein